MLSYIEFFSDCKSKPVKLVTSKLPLFALLIMFPILSNPLLIQVSVGAQLYPQNPVLHVGGSLDFSVEGVCVFGDEIVSISFAYAPAVTVLCIMKFLFACNLR